MKRDKINNSIKWIKTGLAAIIMCAACYTGNLNNKVAVAAEVTEAPSVTPPHTTPSNPPEITPGYEATESPSPSESPSPDVTATPKPGGDEVDIDKFKNSRIDGVKCENYTEKNVTIKWNKNNDAEWYEIWQFNKVTNGYDKIMESDKESCLIDNLKQGEKLTLMVRAGISHGGEKIYTGFSEMLICATIPENVTGFTAAKNAAKSVTLNWDKLSEECEYVIKRCQVGKTEYQDVATVSGNSYTDTKLSVATPYSYKIYAVVKETTVRSLLDTEMSTCTTPNKVQIKTYKGGSFRTRIKWGKVTAADGYVVCVKDAFGQLVDVTRITNLAINTFVHTGLVNDVMYSYVVMPYKLYNGMEYRAEESNEVGVTAKGKILTSKKALLYARAKAIKNSKLYKKYTDFSKAFNIGKSFVIPGLTMTNNLGFESSKNIVQAVCFAGKYMLVSAYDFNSEETSVVYVMNRTTRKYICTLSLPDSYHVGGIAYDGTNVWVSTGKAVSCFAFTDVEAAVKSGEDSYPIYYKTKCNVLTQASFITYYKKQLWIGEHKETTSSRMYSYKISGKKSAAPKLSKVSSMVIPSRTQDVLFLKNGKMIVSCSNQIDAKLSPYYVSRLMLYSPDWKNAGKTVKLGKCLGKMTMPPMIEGIAYRNGYIYVSFESAVIPGCSYKMDRICAMKYSKIKWK